MLLHYFIPFYSWVISNCVCLYTYACMYPVGCLLFYDFLYSAKNFTHTHTNMWYIYIYIHMCVYIYNIIFFIHSLVHRPLYCFHVLPIANSFVMNITVHAYFPKIVRDFFGYMSRNGITWSYGSFIFTFLRKLYTTFYGWPISLNFHQQCRRAYFFPQPLKHVLWVDFLMMANLTGVCWYLSVVLIYFYLIISNV